MNPLKYFTLFIVLCFTLNNSSAQSNRSDYVENYGSKLNVRLGLVNDINKIRITIAEDSVYSLSPNESFKMELSAQYDFLLLSYSYTPNFLPGNNDNALKGETSNRAYGINLFFSRIFGRMSASTTEGYYLENTREIYPSHPEKYVLFGTMKKKQLHIELGFNFNRNFSYKAFSIYNEAQKLSCGSFIPRILYSKNKFEQFDDGSLHERIDDKLTITGNYIHTFVIRKHLFITTGIGLGGGVTYIEDRDDNEEVTNKTYKNSLVQAEFLFQIGHNSDKFFYGFSAFTRATGEVQTEIDNSFTDQNVVSRFYLGYRFNPPKFLVNTFDSAKSLFLRDKDPEDINP